MRLILRDIHDSHKWNNSLILNNNNNSSNIMLTSSNAVSKNSSFRLNYEKKDMTAPVDATTTTTTKAATDSYSLQSNNKPNLVCNCVWSVYFKLHRLHQSTTTQKTHVSSLDTTTTSSMPTAAAIQQQQQQQQQQPLSAGLKKLQEYLFNWVSNISNYELIRNLIDVSCVRANYLIYILIFSLSLYLLIKPETGGLHANIRGAC